MIERVLVGGVLMASSLVELYFSYRETQRAILRVDPATGIARRMPSLDEPLSDLGAALVGGRTYLVGGYTGPGVKTIIPPRAEVKASTARPVAES